MAKFKIKDGIWQVLSEGLKLYFTNFLKFTQYMLFPVFGQVIGILLIFGLTGWFVESLPVLAEEHAIFNNFTTISVVLIFAALPGFAIFLKAFWDFLVAYGALNSMTEAVITTGRLYDFKAHNEVVTRHCAKYLGLLLVISVLSIIAINPLFWVLGLIFFIYFILVFQVFTFEPDCSIFGCFKRSFYLIKGNFGRTFLIMSVLVIISHYVLNAGLSALFDITKLSEFFKGILENWASTLPLADINSSLAYFKLPSITALDIAKEVLSSSILFVIAGLTLPMRSICWSLWYKNLACVKDENNSKKKSGK